jgi:GntR family transcriptional regulator, galactonate operon transcriptional repressor
VTEQFRVGRSVQLWQEVADSLLERIASGEFLPDSVLPSEGALSDAYGVSRSSVRDAMKALQDKGLVRIVHGRGSVVQARDSWSVLDSTVLSARLRHEDAADRVFDELTSVRIALESEMASLAAKNIDAAGRVGLEEAVARMAAAAADPELYLEADMAFHDAIMQLSGNHIAREILSSIEGPLRESREITNRIPEGLATAHDFHVRISEQISSGNADGASALMREHLNWHWERYRVAVPAVSTPDARD